jgi:hypothetical protein
METLTSIFKIQNVQEEFRQAMDNLQKKKYKKGFAENSI